jgi:hypothetical protein
VQICQILATIKPASLDGKPCSLLALSARKALAGTTVKAFNALSAIDTTVLVVVPPSERWKTSPEGGFLGVLHSSCQNFDIGPRELEAGKIDFNLVKEWLTHCCQSHRKTCSPREITVNGLRVINCLTKRVEIAVPKCRYVALSYVWGPSASSTSNDQSQHDSATLTLLPKTVEDSIAATVALGFQYLWVDRYVCFFVGQYNPDSAGLTRITVHKSK